MKAETDKCINCKYFTGSIHWYPRYWSCCNKHECNKNNNYCAYESSKEIIVAQKKEE